MWTRTHLLENVGVDGAYRAESYEEDVNGFGVTVRGGRHLWLGKDGVIFCMLISKRICRYHRHTPLIGLPPYRIRPTLVVGVRQMLTRN